MYTIISVYDVENVKVSNGILIGDKDSHNYNNNSGSSHGWGYGVDVKASENVEINSLQIYNMTGDGIAVSNLPATSTKSNKRRTTMNLSIHNCNIYNNRRQGISIICGENIKIYQNEIHDIEGTLPQSAIDLETNADVNQKIDNIEIYNNKIYNLNKKSQFAIITYYNIYNVSIYNNEIDGRIIIYEINNNLEIKNNLVRNGEILAKISRKNSIRNNITIEENELNKSNINIYDTKYITIINNILKDSEIYYENCEEVNIENNTKNKKVGEENE